MMKQESIAPRATPAPPTAVQASRESRLFTNARRHRPDQ